MFKVLLIFFLFSVSCRAGFFPESNDKGDLEWGTSKDSATSEAEPSPDENLDPEKKENEVVRVTSPKKMKSFLKAIRPEAPLTLVLKNRKSLKCFYSRSNKLGVEVWTDENFELEGRRAFYYSEIKYIEVDQNAFILDQPLEAGG